jgi:hypothetical protein
MLCGTRLGHIAGVAVVLVSLAAPAMAGEVSAKIGGAATVGAGIPGNGSTGANLGLGAGAGGAWNGGTDLSAGADGQVTTSAAPFQSNGSAGSVPLGLDRFAVRGDGSTNVSVFYKVLKTHF